MGSLHDGHIVNAQFRLQIVDRDKEDVGPGGANLRCHQAD